MSWLTGGKDPSKAANDYYSQIPGAVQPYYQPYIDQGRQANDVVSQQYGNLINNPGDVYSNLGKGYTQSPGYQFKLSQALQAGNNAQAAGGMAGSAQHEQQNMGIANDIASQDFNDYIKQIMGLYGTGLQGEQGLQTQGYNASTGYGDILGNTLGQQGQAAYNGQAAQNAAHSNMFGNFVNLGATVAGGPIGGAIAGAINPWKNPGSMPGWGQ